MATQPPASSLPIFYQDLAPLSSNVHGNYHSRPADKAPFLVERPVGRGKVLWVASGVSAQWNNLARTHAMLIFDRLLRDMLRAVPIDSIYSSKYQRTRQTVTPTAEAQKRPVNIHATADIPRIAATIRAAQAAEASGSL